MLYSLIGRFGSTLAERVWREDGRAAMVEGVMVMLSNRLNSVSELGRLVFSNLAWISLAGNELKLSASSVR